MQRFFENGGPLAVSVLSLLFLATSVVAQSPSDLGDPRARAGELLTLASDQAMNGHGDEALAAALAAANIFRGLDDRRGEAASLMFAGLSNATKKEAQAARASFEASAEIFLEEGDRFSAWFLLWLLGELEHVQGREAAALGRLDQALQQVDALRANPASIRLDTFFLMSKVYSGSIELPSLLPAIELIAPILIQMAEGATRASYGAVLTGLGRLDEAEIELEKALVVARRFQGLFGTRVHAHLAELRRRQGRLAEAREHDDKAQGGAGGFFSLLSAQDSMDVKKADDDEREGPREGSPSRIIRRRDRFREGQILAEDGFLALQQNEYGKAASQLERAAGIFRELDEPWLEAEVLNRLAEVYIRLENPNSARTVIDRAAVLWQETPLELGQGVARVLEAWSLFRGGEADLKEVLQAWSTLWGSTEVNRYDLPSGFSEHIQMLLHAVVMYGEVDSAVTPGQLQQIKRDDLPFFSAMAYFLEGQLAYDRGEAVEARQAWLEALEYLDAASHRALVSVIAADIAITYWLDHDRTEAITWLRKAVAGFEETASEVYVEELLSSYLGSERRWFYDLMIQFLIEEERYEEAFEVSERARSQTLLRLLGSPKTERKEGERYLAGEVKRLQEAIAEENFKLRDLEGDTAEVKGNLRRLRQEYERLIVRLKVTQREYSSILDVESPRLGQVQDSLGPREALVSYFFSEVEVHVWVVGRDSFHYVKLATAPEDLRQRILAAADVIGRREENLARSWAYSKGEGPVLEPGRIEEATEGVTVPTVGIADPGVEPAVARSSQPRGIRGVKVVDGVELERFDIVGLNRQIIAPLRPYLQGKNALILVPHGALHYFPFAAIHDAQGRFLIEDFTLTYAPSAGARRFLRANESSFRGRALVLGRPKELDNQLSEIPASETEAEVVGRLLGSTALLHTKATESRLYSLDGSIDVVHVASHGFFDPDSSSFSHLALAPGNGEDGYLEVHEIFGRLNLTGVNLIVLSACDTARGKRSGGDDLVSITRAFLFAGTPGVLSTLWQIDDAATAVLISRFYQHWLAGGTAATALQATQVEFALGEDGSDPHPYFWAGFVLAGDPQAMWSDR